MVTPVKVDALVVVMDLANGDAKALVRVDVKEPVGVHAKVAKAAAEVVVAGHVQALVRHVVLVNQAN